MTQARCPGRLVAWSANSRLSCPRPSASNGEALALIDSLRPDVVLLDIRMPGLDGLQVAAKLCEREAPPAVIFCTAHDEFALEAFDVSAVGYLVKPVRPEALAAALKAERGPTACSSRR